ncbi:MAG TPA: hypothetical protein P5551_08495 [Syntrophales bacterium]|nr:hypothetical protein [Syntrophales bacterium]HRT62381.1 hypothetical protein [Syntrophales bacterium]
MTEKSLDIEVCTCSREEGESIRSMIEEALRRRDIKGYVKVSWVPAIGSTIFGLRDLPAVLINKRVLKQGVSPNRREVEAWFEWLFPLDEPREPGNEPPPATVSEAVNHIIDRMSFKTRVAVAHMSDEEVAIFNVFGWGEGIREDFGLWEENENLMEDCCAEDPFEASLLIIQTVRNRLRGRGTPG